jgi:hypothetical protein
MMMRGALNLEETNNEIRKSFQPSNAGAGGISYSGINISQDPTATDSIIKSKGTLKENRYESQKSLLPPSGGAQGLLARMR